MKDAQKLKHDYAYFHEKCDMVLPFLDVRSYDFDSGRFLEASGVQWNYCFALKPAENRKTVLKNFSKNSKFVYGLSAAFRVLSFRVCISICMGTD